MKLDTSFIFTVPTINSILDIKPKRADSPEARCVRFSTDQEVVSFDPVTEEERAKVWYHNTELSNFQAENWRLAGEIRAQEKRCRDSPGCSDSLRLVYRAFHGDNPTHVIMAFLQSTDVVVDENTVGLEQLVIPDMTQDCRVRHRVLLSRIKRLQRICMPDETTRAEEICEQSRQASRASRLFALFTAQMAAEASCERGESLNATKKSHLKDILNDILSE